MLTPGGGSQVQQSIQLESIRRDTGEKLKISQILCFFACNQKGNKIILPEPQLIAAAHDEHACPSNYFKYNCALVYTKTTTSNHMIYVEVLVYMS